MLDIERIYVKPITPKGDLVGYAQIELAGGFFLSGIKIIKDRENKGAIHLSFPVKFDDSGKMHRFHYPNTQAMRDFLTDAVFKIYVEQILEGDNNR